METRSRMNNALIGLMPMKYIEMIVILGDAMYHSVDAAEKENLENENADTETQLRVFKKWHIILRRVSAITQFSIFFGIPSQPTSFEFEEMDSVETRKKCKVDTAEMYLLIHAEYGRVASLDGLFRMFEIDLATVSFEEAVSSIENIADKKSN